MTRAEVKPAKRERKPRWFRDSEGGFVASVRDDGVIQVDRTLIYPGKELENFEKWIAKARRYAEKLGEK